MIKLKKGGKREKERKRERKKEKKGRKERKNFGLELELLVIASERDILRQAATDGHLFCF